MSRVVSPTFRLVEPDRAYILGMFWQVRNAPDGLPGGAEAHVDHEQRIIWLDVTPRRRDLVLSGALGRAASEAVARLPLVS